MLRYVRKPAHVLSSRSRARKLQHLKTVIRPGASVLVIGVSTVTGLGTQSVVERGLLDHAKVTALAYEEISRQAFPAALVRGDGRRLPFKDHSFDYVFSNAVLEHLGGPVGAVDMLLESTRVARIGWIHTTPNRRFPVEVHTGVPFAHWLPQDLRMAAFRWAGFDFPPQRYWLMTARQLRKLAPGADLIALGRGRPAMTLLISRMHAEGVTGYQDPAAPPATVKRSARSLFPQISALRSRR